jgi:hypothetical protein
MQWLSAPEYWLSRLVFWRGLGFVYLVAFSSVVHQFRPLLGEEGLVPTPRFLAHVTFRKAPSVFHLHYSDRFASAVAWAGTILAAAVVAGLVEQAPLAVGMLVWLTLWALYLSFVNVGQPFFSFVWESLLLEAGFLAIFLGNNHMAPPLLIIFLIRWLLFRLEVGAGLIKLRHDVAWRDLTALYYHHETQPMPNPLSWYFHHLPKGVHKVEVAANHFAQLVVPFLLFAPQPIASIAGAIVIGTQLWLLLSGNFAWLNVLALTLAVSAVSDRALHHVLPVSRPALHDPPLWFAVVVIVVTAAIGILSYRPVRNMASRRQVMNASFNPLHIANTYGLFGQITRERNEVVVEGTDDAELGPTTHWKEYEFKAKPGDPRRRPPQVAPYHLRLDWLMWFAAISPAYAEPWFVPFIAKLLDDDRATLRLLRSNPLPDRPPTFVRARLYRYRFTTAQQRRATGAWWTRELLGEYLPPLALRPRVDTEPGLGTAA